MVRVGRKGEGDDSEEKGYLFESLGCERRMEREGERGREGECKLMW